jgi:hypothetical protein
LGEFRRDVRSGETQVRMRFSAGGAVVKGLTAADTGRTSSAYFYYPELIIIFAQGFIYSKIAYKTLRKSKYSPISKARIVAIFLKSFDAFDRQGRFVAEK